MLKDSLYKIKTLTHHDGVIEAMLEVNEHHEILKGHFPGQPVLPGACMLQMVKEVLKEALAKTMQLQKAGNVKFMQVVDPHQNNILQLNLNYKWDGDSLVQVNASLLSAEIVTFKFQGIFRVV